MNLEIDYLWSHKCPKKWNQYTLIALVITIIVLLILAGVTIATLTGDNGLLQKATNSKGETIKAEGLERLKLAVVASYDTNGKVDTQNLAKNLSEIDGLKYINNENQEVNVLENTEIQLTAKFKLNGYNYKISDEGKVTYKKEGTADNEDIMKSPSTYYGKYVTNYNSLSDAGIKDETGQLGKWQIFMADEDSIYLIASNYITRQYTGTKNGIGYSYYKKNQQVEVATNMWFAYINENCIMNQYKANSTKTDIPELLSKFDDKTNKTYHKWMNIKANQTRNNGNDKSVASMLDVDNIWSGYNNTKYAKYAIGGPTLEMFCKVYNETRMEGTSLLEAKETNENNNFGYSIIKGESNPATAVSGLKIGTTNTDVDSMLFKSSNEGNAYWFSSPSAGDNAAVILLSATGQLAFGSVYYYNESGFRPLVCLKSNVHLVENKNGTTTTYELELD